MRVLIGIVVVLMMLGYPSWSDISKDGAKVDFLKTSFADVVAQAKNEGKMIFFDAYTTWCGPCKMMDSQVFVDPKVAAFFNENFINAKFDMEAGEGPELKQKYGVAAYPTFIFIDRNNEESVHQLVGFIKAEGLLSEAEKVLSGEGTVASYSAKYQAGNRDKDFVMSYLDVLDKSYQKEEAEQVAKEYLATQPLESLGETENWQIFIQYINDPYSPAFVYFQDHLQDFVDSKEKMLIENKLMFGYVAYARNTYFVRDKEHKLVSFDKKGFSKHMAYVKKQEMPNKSKILAELEVTEARESQDWVAYVKLIDAGLETGTVPSGSMSLYNYALVVNRQEDLPKKCAYVAAEWMAECIAMAGHPQALKAYNRVYADLLEKAGMEKDAEKVRSQLNETSDENTNQNTSGAGGAALIKLN